MKKVVLVNDDESYLLENKNLDECDPAAQNRFLHNNKMKKMRQMSGVQNIVLHIHPDQYGDFYLIISDDYDQEFSVIHSEDPDFRLNFKCQVEPGAISFHDINVQEIMNNDVK